MAEHRKSLDDCAREYAEMSQDKLPSSLGFSARLNMLWDLAGVAPSQFEGRVLGVMAINTQWRETEIRKWLQKDVLPPAAIFAIWLFFWSRNWVRVKVLSAGRHF